MLHRFIFNINRILAFFIVLLFVVLLLFVCWSVFTRYALNNPSVNSEEIIRFCLIWLVFLGSAYTLGEKKHLAIEALINKLKGAKLHRLQILIHFIVLSISVLILVYGGGKLSWRVYFSNQLSPTLHLPMGIVYLIFPISGLIMTLYTLIFIYEELTLLKKEK